MSNIIQYKIAQLRLKKIIFRKCTCKGFVVLTLEGNRKKDSLYYCERCRKIVDKFLYNYKFDMTVLDLFENVIEDISVYDKVAESLIGCPPEKLVKYIQEDNTFLDKLEQVGKGLYITVEIFPPNQQFPTKKAKTIKLDYNHDLKLIDILFKYNK